MSPKNTGQFGASIGNALYKREKIAWNNLHRFAFSRGLAYLLCFTWQKLKYTKEKAMAKLKGK
jgi:hypothetical protein